MAEMKTIDDRLTVRSRWQTPGSPRIARVMAISEGWVMYRFKNTMPAILYWKDFVKKFVPAGPRG